MSRGKILFPIQAVGLGDIIFEMTLIRNFILEGYKVIWGVRDCFMEGLNQAYPDVTFINEKLINIDYDNKNDYEDDGARYLPLRWTDSLCGVPYRDCMKSKYLFFNQDWQIWDTNAQYQRYPEKEQELKYKILGILLGEKYNLINTRFTSFESHRVPIDVNNGYRNIEISTLSGYSLFDWSLVIEGAETIYTVSTSIIYILELLELAAKEIHIYIRRPQEQNHNNYDYILRKHNYILHD